MNDQYWLIKKKFLKKKNQIFQKNFLFPVVGNIPFVFKFFKMKLFILFFWLCGSLLLTSHHNHRTKAFCGRSESLPEFIVPSLVWKSLSIIEFFYRWKLFLFLNLILNKKSFEGKKMQFPEILSKSQIRNNYKKR